MTWKLCIVLALVVMAVSSLGLRSRRLAAGLTQQELAESVSVSRQTIGALEAGGGGCGVELALRLAGALGCRVEELFEAPGASAVADLVGEEAGAVGARRVAVGEIRGRLVARRLGSVQGRLWATQPAHGLVQGRAASGGVHVRWLRGGRRGVFVAGCDPAAGLLAEHASRAGRSTDAYWWPAGNARAVAELVRGHAHAVTVHREEGAPAPDFGFPVERVRLASWQMGWVVAAGNPRGFGSAADLSGSPLVLANREPGSGARRLLDELLDRAGVARDAVRGYERAFLGHAEVASAVRFGAADAGLAIAVAAEAEGLDFLPVTRHVCDLYVPRAEAREEPARALLDALTSKSFQNELTAFGPYDTSELGDAVG